MITRVVPSTKGKIKLQSESESFPSLLDAFKSNIKYIEVNCETSHTRSSGRDDFKPNSLDERRKNLYSSRINARVVPVKATNNYIKKCVMHPCNIKAKQLESVSFQSSVSAYLTTIEEEEEKKMEFLGFGKISQRPLKISHVQLSTDGKRKQQDVLDYLKHSGVDNVVFKNLSSGENGEYLFDSTRKLLYLLTGKTLSNWLLGKYSTYSVYTAKKKTFKCFVVRPKMQSQGMFDALGEIFTVVNGTSKVLLKAIQNYKNPQVIAWVMDVLTLTIEMNDPYFWTPITMLKFFVRLYSTIMRFTDFKNKAMQSQSLEEVTSVDSIMLLLACFGLPEPIMKGLKQISLMTNKKILDSPNIIMDLIQQFLEICYDVLQWLKETLKLEIVDAIIDMLAQPLSFVKGLKLTKKLGKMTVDFQKNNQIMFDPVVREECMELYTEIQLNLYIQTLLSNPAYRIYQKQFSTLEVMYKAAKNFDTSARNEPVCIVFEGKAGSGKSTLMNKVIEYLVKKSYSTYTHTCPALEASKDWYDDYLGQDVFIMDDVGQQGISQWRQIINFVSPVKFPLECAEATAKNTKFFNSKLLLVTTNHFSDLRGFTKSDCIAEPEALFRRCHVLNFDKTGFSNGKLNGHIQYKKYDYVSHIWRTEFIGPHSACNLNPKCEVASSNKTVAWVYNIITSLLDVQQDMFTNNALQPEDVEEIDALVSELRTPNEMLWDHEDLDFSLPVFNQPSSAQLTTQSNATWLMQLAEDNIAIFREYFSSMKESLVENTISIFTTLQYTFNEDSYAGAALQGALKGLICALATCAISKMRDYFIGDCNPSELNISTFREQSVKIWHTAHQDYVAKTVPSVIVDDTNDTLLEIVRPCSELGTRISSLRSRMRIVELVSKSGYKNVSQGIVSGRRVLVQCHSYDTLEGIANIFKDWNCFSNSSYECNNVPFKIVKEWPEYDMTIIELDLSIPIYKDATHSLFNKNLEDDVPFNARRLFFVNAQAALSLDNNFTINNDSFQIQSPIVGKKFNVPAGSGVEYGISAPGLCGSLLVDSDQGLCGVHIAGNAENGFAFVLPKRILRELKNLLTFRESQHIELKDNIVPHYSGLKIFNDSFPSKRPLQQTTLNKSELYEFLKDEIEVVGKKVPPNFRSFGSKTLEKIAEKSLKPIPHIHNDAIEFGKKCIRRFMVKFNDLTDVEVINGLKEEELSGLNKKSVNGFGYSNDKEDYIDFPSGEITPIFKQKMQEFIMNCKTDSTKIQDLLFYEAFKDELRMEEKKDKPRSFRVAPLHHTFLVKKYIGKLFIHCKKNMWSNQMAIGMNPYRDWDMLYKKLKTAYINFDGDFGNWDGGAPAQVQDAISEMIMEFYEGDDPETLKVLLNSMVRTFVLIKEKVVLTTHSMPSGCWVTAFFNSLINRFLTAMVLHVEMSKDDKIPTTDDFDRIIDFVMGDDKICGSPPDLMKYFNAITMRDFAHSIGMKYTDGDKGEITEISKPLTECVFLKRHFHFHKKLGKIVGPLSLTTLINSLCYKDSSRNYDEIMGGKMTAFQFEIYLHENNKLKFKVINAAHACSFFFIEFSEEHIAKTMQADDTYATVMGCLGKHISNFS